MISVLIAASLIVTALAGVGVASVYMKSVLKKNELSTMAVATEADLISAFNNKLNYPDPGGMVASPNPMLRAGTITSLTLNTATLGTLVVPVYSAPPVKSLVQFMDWNRAPCGGFDGKNCVLRLEVRLKKSLICGPPVCPAGQEIYSYAFSYQVDADPSIVPMSPLGNATNFDTLIDPGYYRVESTLAACNPATDLFMTGVNRDTGEAFCAKKPVTARCADGHIPKGVKYTPHPGGEPTIELDCTVDTMRTFSCDPNYSLQSFTPVYTDPDNKTFTKVPGTCVLGTRNPAVTPSSYPPSPTPYMLSVSGTICPPMYKVASGSYCTLVENTSRTKSGDGRGWCADTAYKNCHQTTSTWGLVDNSAAVNAWTTSCASKPATGPCDILLKPPAQVPGYTCYGTRTALNCGPSYTVTSHTGDASCDVDSGWDSGTAYAINPGYTYPTATPHGSASGRNYTCSFTDTSTACSAPARDFSGNLMTYKTPKWYGGVQIVGATCIYDSAQNSGKPETLPAF